MAPEFFFDMDDTLIYNQYMYTKAYAEFIDFMLKKINAKPSAKEHSNEILQIIKHTSPKCQGIEEIIKTHDLDNLLHDMFTIVNNFNIEGGRDNPENPYNRERVPKAFRKAYFDICKKYDSPILETDADEAYEIGKVFHNVNKDVVEGAEDVLEFLKEKKCKTSIFTCGDVWLQQKKIEINGFDKYFDKNRQIIVPIKHNGEIKNYINGCDPNQTFMVGNSIKADIAPAVESGIRAIYFPSATYYSWDDVEMKKDHGSKVLTIIDLREIISNYDLLASLK